ncbi:Uncharacterised protein [Serratia quinivorans]|nr:Uncharacterised protein [Serratia quinivorans]CAI1144069.1 Uncharacterised protein [Serratia quinivorans]CAI1177173.1 Uncharacterised protein [Serratia quinivorans]CAI2131106.1 Uncharacterised protein [Serratia quinivorans]
MYISSGSFIHRGMVDIAFCAGSIKGVLVWNIQFGIVAVALNQVLDIRFSPR